MIFWQKLVIIELFILYSYSMRYFLMKIFIILFFLILSFWMFLFWLGAEDQDKYLPIITGFVSFTYFLFVLVKIIVNFIKNPAKFLSKLKKQNAKRLASKKNNNLQKLRSMDLFIFKTPLVWGLYSISFLLISLFFYLDFAKDYHFILNFLRFFNIYQYGYISIFLIFFLYWFVILSIILMPFLILAEIYQKRIKNTKSNIISQVIIDYIYSIPYLAIWSILWAIFIIVTWLQGKEKDKVKIISQWSWIFLFIKAYSFWLYYSLASIAYDDKRTLFPAQSPIKFYKTNRKNIFQSWLHNTLIFFIPFALYILFYMLFMIPVYFRLISSETASILFKNITIYFWGFSMLFFFVWIIISAQLNMLNYYIIKSEKLSVDFALDIIN